MSNDFSDAKMRIQSLIELTEALSDIFKRESTLLKANRAHDLPALQKEKARLSAAYMTAVRALSADRALIASAQSGLLSQLRGVTSEFQERAQEHQSFIQSARESAVAAAGLEQCVQQATPEYKEALEQIHAQAPLNVSHKA